MLLKGLFMEYLEKLGITIEQFKERLAICEFYKISNQDFYERKLYMIDAKVLFARIAISHTVDLNTLSASKEDYQKLTGYSDDLIIEIFTYSSTLKEHFLKYFSIMHGSLNQLDLAYIENEKE